MADDTTTVTHRITRNTLYLYVRQLLVMVLSLYTSRVVLEVLGTDDYGVYSVVGGTVAMLSLLSGSLSGSIGRFITYTLGRGDPRELRNIISMSLGIQIIMTFIVCVVAETAGVWFVTHRLVLPAGREAAAVVVLQSSVVSFVFMLLSTPYMALVVAYERLYVFAMVGVGETLLRLAGVLLLVHSGESCRLEIYACLMAVISVAANSVYVIYSLYQFSDSRVCPRFMGSSFKALGVFAGWNTIGASAALLRDQGVNILLNLFYGPTINAARAIAMSAGIVALAFSDNFMTALRPHITKLYAAGDTARSLSLVERGARLGFCLTFIVVLPLLLVTPAVLRLWLDEYPCFTVVFVRLTLIGCLIETLSLTLITLQVATGRIRNYQIAVGGLLLLNFPISYFVLRYGALPWSVYVISLIIATLCLCARLWFLRAMAGLSVVSYRRHAPRPAIIVIWSALPLPLSLPFFIGEYLSYTILTGSVSTVSAVICVWFFGLGSDERNAVLMRLRRLVQAHRQTV
ncbi:MAG: lipopolysaccharide biosynthesis protein [Muribaculaceae bacterium]|nr:lipopolysaccharide biosynthesis protein [Muribaculaceae bacterium]